MATSVLPAASQSRAAHRFSAGIVADESGRAWRTAYVEPGEEAKREFEARRILFARSGRRSPVEQVAAFLVAISRNNSYEGRDPSTIPDSLTCGFVADLLGFSITALAGLLVELEERGLVAPTPSSGLRLTDLTGLERLAEAA